MLYKRQHGGRVGCFERCDTRFRTASRVVRKSRIHDAYAKDLSGQHIYNYVRNRRRRKDEEQETVGYPTIGAALANIVVLLTVDLV